MIKNFFLFLILISLLGCKPSEDEIKKFGFENLEEMLRVRGQGVGVGVGTVFIR